MSAPWVKFYTSDWRADPALRMCSLAARGLWMEMLCVMHEAQPYGSLLVNGQQVSGRQMAGLASATQKETAATLKELEDAGVFSRDPDGTVFSRRMRRDIVKAERDKANGKRGGNPNINRSVNARANGWVNPEDKAQKLEARVQKPERKKDEDASAASSSNEKYAFESGCIKLNTKDLEQWRKAFPNLSLESELTGLSAWAADQRKWFNAVAGALAKKQRETVLKIEKMRLETTPEKPLSDADYWDRGL